VRGSSATQSQSRGAGHIFGVRQRLAIEQPNEWLVPISRLVTRRSFRSMPPLRASFEMLRRRQVRVVRMPRFTGTRWGVKLNREVRARRQRDLFFDSA